MSLAVIAMIAVGLAFAGLFADVKIQEGRAASAVAQVKAEQANTKAAQADVATAKAAYTTCQSANVDLGKTIESQNAGIKQLQTIAKDRETRANAAVAALAKARALAKSHDATLANQPPPVPGDSCKSACAALAQPL